MKKKNQHYVFQAYLSPWAENAQVYFLRDEEIFRTNLRNVACERFFYRLQELTPDEVRLIERSLVEYSVEPLNILMVRNSHEQIFSNSKEYLTSIKNVVGQLRN